MYSFFKAIVDRHHSDTTSRTDSSTWNVDVAANKPRVGRAVGL